MLDDIKREEYLEYASRMTTAELDLMKSLNDWLPNSIIDCHAHCNLQEHIHSIRLRDFNHMISTFPSFSLNESLYWNRLFHENKKIRTLRFSGVMYGTDHIKANAYLLDNSPADDKVALFGLPDDIEYTIRMLDHHRVSALKMYAAYFEPAARQIFDFFPKGVLEVAQNKNIPIILHLPLKISSCIGQILTLIACFPKLKICLAHIGLEEIVTNSLTQALKSVSQFSNVYFDTALVQSSDVIREAVKIVGPEKVMYGSDAPFNLIRSTTYINPELGWRLVTEHSYHWVNAEEHKSYKHLALDVPHDHWQAIAAIRNGLSHFSISDQSFMKQLIFHDNAKLFYEF